MYSVSENHQAESYQKQIRASQIQASSLAPQKRFGHYRQNLVFRRLSRSLFAEGERTVVEHVIASLSTNQTGYMLDWLSDLERINPGAYSDTIKRMGGVS